MSKETFQIPNNDSVDQLYSRVLDLISYHVHSMPRGENRGTTANNRSGIDFLIRVISKDLSHEESELFRAACETGKHDVYKLIDWSSESVNASCQTSFNRAVVDHSGEDVTWTFHERNSERLEYTIQRLYPLLKHTTFSDPDLNILHTIQHLMQTNLKAFDFKLEDVSRNHIDAYCAGYIYGTLLYIHELSTNSFVDFSRPIPFKPR